MCEKKQKGTYEHILINLLQKKVRKNGNKTLNIKKLLNTL